MKHRRPTTLLVLAVGAAAAVVALGGGASASSEGRLYIGINLHFTGPDTTAGNFVMSGAREDSGVTNVDHLSLVPIGTSDTARLSGNQTFVGAKGTIVTRFEGKALMISSPHQVGRGRSTIVSGTAITRA
jgi:hypothetical protein